MLLVSALVEAPVAGWLGGRTITVLIVAGALVALFGLITARSAAPLVPLSIFHSRTRVGGILVTSATAERMNGPQG